jgi:hypothetical protein
MFKPVDQQIIDDGRGDCLRACVCSVLGLDPAEVPNFAELDFFNGLNQWLEPRGRQFIWIAISHVHSLTGFYFGHAPEYLLVYGESPRLRVDGGKKQHIVVMRPKGYGAELVHDPHPDRNGLVNIHGFGFIVSR